MRGWQRAYIVLPVARQVVLPNGGSAGDKLRVMTPQGLQVTAVYLSADSSTTLDYSLLTPQVALELPSNAPAGSTISFRLENAPTVLDTCSPCVAAKASVEGGKFEAVVPRSARSQAGAKLQARLL